MKEEPEEEEEDADADGDGLRCCSGGGGFELAGGLDARAARVDAAACEAGLCWRCELVVDGCGGSE